MEEWEWGCMKIGERTYGDGTTSNVVEETDDELLVCLSNLLAS